MSPKKKSLPTPPRKAFGHGPRSGSDERSRPSLEEGLAQAAARGRLDEYISENFGESGNARRLAEMMMEMTGMIQAPAASSGTVEKKAKNVDSSEKQSESGKTSVPGDIIAAASSGNVGELIQLLKREQGKISGEKDVSAKSGGKPQRKKTGKKVAGAEDQGFIEKKVLDQLIKIASDNNVTMDWLIARALSLYVRDYLATGRM